MCANSSEDCSSLLLYRAEGMSVRKRSCNVIWVFILRLRKCIYLVSDHLSLCLSRNCTHHLLSPVSLVVFSAGFRFLALQSKIWLSGYLFQSFTSAYLQPTSVHWRWTTAGLQQIEVEFPSLQWCQELRCKLSNCVRNNITPHPLPWWSGT